MNRDKPVAAPFEGFNFSKFWDDSEYALKEYVGTSPTDELIAALEQELGYRLPASYIWLMKRHNGGIPYNTCCPCDSPTSWAKDHVAITGIFGIGRDKPHTLGGSRGSRFWIEAWGYPDIGIAICDCPSAGHDMIFLDYRACGPKGEPSVVHVDQELNYKITHLADNFESFIRKLVHEICFDTSEDDKQNDLEKVANGRFSDLLSHLCAQVDSSIQIEKKIREIARQIIEEKGYFALHADARSYLLYDIQFWLYTNAYPDTPEEAYLQEYEKMIAFGDEFSTEGYAPDFVRDWLAARKMCGIIVEENDALSMPEDHVGFLIKRLENGAG